MKLSLLFVAILLPQLALAGGGAGKNANAGEPFEVPTAEEMISDFSQPWGAPLTELKSQMKRNGSYIYWVMVHPESPMDLRTPEKFRRFIVGNTPFKGGISHNMVAWSCEGARGRRVEGATAMSGESNGQSTKMILDGFGLSTFFSTFTDGYIEHTESVQEGILDIGRKHGMSTIGFEVEPQQCQQMISFLKKFARHPNKPFTRFGLTPNPEKMEGGGCVTFAMALLNQAGIFRDLIPNFYRNLSAPAELLGGNMPLPPYTEMPNLRWLNGQPHRISMNRLLSTSWIPHDKAVNLRIMDPELMLYSMRTIKDVYTTQFLPELSAAEAKDLERSSLKARSVRSATGDGNSAGSAQYIPINDSFDPQMAKVGELTAKWSLEQLRQGKIIERSSMNGYPVFLIRR